MAKFCISILFLHLVLCSIVHGGQYILDVSVKCGPRLSNRPVINILTDVPLAATARCKGGNQEFTSTDNVHFTLAGSYFSGKACRWYKHRGIFTYTVDVFIRYGEVGSLILTKDKIKTLVCTYNPYGKDKSPALTVGNPFLAPRELGTIIGSAIPSNQIVITVQDVRNRNVKAHLNLDRRYSVFGRYIGKAAGSLRPVSCDAISGKGKRYAVLRAGCGDGLIFAKDEGFVVSGKTFRSPYFQGFHLQDPKISFECRVVLCAGLCGGSTCDQKCSAGPSFKVANAKLGKCADYKHKKKCSYSCKTGYIVRSGSGLTTCHADGTWTKPTLVCALKNCGRAPGIANGRGVKTNGSTFGKYYQYSCNKGFRLVGSSRIFCRITGWSKRPTCVKITKG